MSDSNERPEAKGTLPEIRSNGDPEAKLKTHNGPPTADSRMEEARPKDDPTEALKRDLDKYHLPADVKEQILAQLPSPEEMERQYRELMENGGLSFEECFGDLLAESGEKP